IAQIRDAADIVAVISQHVQLKRSGTSWKGLCPFHGEKTPSFNVIPVKRFFEVAEELATRFGITVPRVEESPELRRARGERLAMLEMNKLATAFYREVL